jgi:hypothetical protein
MIFELPSIIIFFLAYCLVHCKCTVPKIRKQILPEMKLRCLVPNFYSNVFVSDLYIPTIGPQMQ